MSFSRFILLWLNLSLTLAFVAKPRLSPSFVVPSTKAPVPPHPRTTYSTTTISFAPDSSSTEIVSESIRGGLLTTDLLAAATVDPTTFLSDLLGGLIGTPAILAIPIVAALGVAGLVAFAIISYANPRED